VYNRFPGMNPYLEQAGLWQQCHNRLIVAIADALTPQVAPQYRVSIEERGYASLDDALLVGIADVAVADRQTGKTAVVTPAKLTEPIEVTLPMPEETTERYLEVRLTQTDEVVCVVEVLSPKNKRKGEGQQAYETKRLRVLSSLTNLVEIDLLRGGQPLPLLGQTSNSVYRVLVSRSSQRPRADLYPIGLQSTLPTIPVPLSDAVPEPTVDLSQVFNEVFDRARFDLAIDYAQPLKPALPEADQQWVGQLLSSLT